MITLNLSSTQMKTERSAFVMGIVNATPDSFFEKSRGGIELAEKLIDEGADILDVGAESTRPGSSPVDEEEELKRLIPLIEKIRKVSSIPLSVDTRKMNVMKRAFEAGADILNDVSALEDDENMADFASKVKIPVVLMHGFSESRKNHEKTSEKNIFKTVSEYLSERAEYAVSRGIREDRIIIDPGIGFGKNLSENVSLIKNAGRLCGGKYRILMALSRKRCIGEMTGNGTEERLYGTLCADIVSVMNGAQIIRVHDVKAAVDTLEVLRYIY